MAKRRWMANRPDTVLWDVIELPDGSRYIVDPEKREYITPPPCIDDDALVERRFRDRVKWTTGEAGTAYPFLWLRRQLDNIDDREALDARRAAAVAVLEMKYTHSLIGTNASTIATERR